MVKLSIAAFFTKRERSSKVSSTSLWRPVHRLFIHAFVLGLYGLMLTQFQKSFMIG